MWIAIDQDIGQHIDQDNDRDQAMDYNMGMDTGEDTLHTEKIIDQDMGYDMHCIHALRMPA